MAVDNAGKLVAVAASGQNLDRLVSCFRAARRSHRQFVIDAYQAYVLMQLAPLSKNIPQFSWDGVRVKFAHHQVERLKEAGLMDLVRDMSAQGRVSSDELTAEPGRYLMSTRGRYGVTQLFDKVGPQNVVPAWSMRSGYWERDGSPMREWAERHGVEVHLVHSGGHAWPEDLRRLQDAVAAREAVWVHADSQGPGTSAQSLGDRIDSTDNTHRSVGPGDCVTDPTELPQVRAAPPLTAS